MDEATPFDGPPSDEDGMTIDQLAAALGMSVRNLREWRALGLLPAPRMVGRVGRYDAPVLARMREVQRLRSVGFPLELIARLIEVRGGLVDDVLKLADLLRSPLQADEQDRVGTRDAQGFADDASPQERAAAVALGIIEGYGAGAPRFTSSRMARVAAAMQRMGLTAGESIAAATAIRVHLDAIAGVFEQVWRDHVWAPFMTEDVPADAQGHVQQLAGELPGIALDTVLAHFTIAMRHRIEAGIATEVSRALGAGERGSE